ncbi:uncharacterized protein KY384_006116 [Bacidia gigantensis]|uniref:uncharacterized protein n=1 Tax=Bacidia gigantensis TaxID=2732470 RepID=UPI001D0436BA|nr:uncharacterized protein KY384_006116 [Bacidia gigantensis]KAG8529479.1 hypothetical protein KY384_006116 [Bacidia gigantensis]
MADVNPLKQAYPTLSPTCSKKVFCIAGILTAVYGLDELTANHNGVACGTALDVSQLMDYLSSYAFPLQHTCITKHLVCGVSLGGHAAWHCLFNDPRISAAISIVGCPDYYRLMEDRARLSKVSSWQDGVFRGSKDFSNGLVEAIEKHDPVASIIKDLYLGDEVWSLLDNNINMKQQQLLATRLTSRLTGKRLLNMSGGADKLVPYRCSEPFVNFLTQAIGPAGCLNGSDFHMKDKVFDGVGHEMTPDMAAEVNRFVLETLIQTPTSSHMNKSKI